MKKKIKLYIIKLEEKIQRRYLKFKKIDIGQGVKVRGKIFLKNNGNIIIRDNVTINSRLSANPISGQMYTSLLVSQNARLIIDKGAGISNSSISVFNSVYIGEDVFIGAGCKIFDTDFHSVNYEKRMSKNDDDIKSSPIVLEKGCFIGSNTIILKGVTIGKFSVVGAGSVVTKNIPSNEIWGGNPAKFIKKL